jgi:beta-lactam-binding protein with PASTA domain
MAGSSKVDDEFVDHLVYSTYKAIYESLGKQSWDVVFPQRLSSTLEKNRVSQS